MASDAYMELQDPSVWGETYDAQFGETGRGLGAFEIFGFDISATSSRQDDSDDGANTQMAALQSLFASQASSGHGPGQGPRRAGGMAGAGVMASKHSQPVLKTFTIKKFIDKASPDLLIGCCKAGCPDAQKIDWAIISFRESGDPNQKPWLILEFRGLWVENFSWSMTPGADSTSASQEETLTFSFETILIKYSRQVGGSEELKPGEHQPIKIRGWDRVNNKNYGDELPPPEQLHG